MSKSNVTPAEFLRAMLAAAERTPDAVNPTERGACLYVRPGDPKHPNEAPHCIIGQTLVDLGVDPGDLAEHEWLPGTDVVYGLLGLLDVASPAPDAEWWENEFYEAVSEVQRAADAIDAGTGPPPWGEVIDICRHDIDAALAEYDAALAEYEDESPLLANPVKRLKGDSK